MDLRIALDTSRLVAMFRGDRALAEDLARLDDVAVPIVVVGELQAGAASSRRAGAHELLLRTFLNKPNVNVLQAGIETAEIYGRLFAQLRRAGTPIPTNDIWIAAQALEHNLPLMTSDQHFLRIPQLRTI
ncbi:MAG: type II toxin-antitoxin system VapC family toxin [Terriglobales bacterium]